MPGVILKHDSLANRLWVVENPARPYGDGGYDCNMCVGVHHYGKATHLWLEPNGCCIVSEGVLEELKRAGMPQLTVTGHVADPPPLQVGRVNRTELDNRNRAMWIPDPILEGVT